MQNEASSSSTSKTDTPAAPPLGELSNPMGLTERVFHQLLGVRNMKAFITVIGHDTVGVVAKVAALCSELNINIEDVTQSILQGMFAMIMLVDISHCSVSHEELHNRTDALAKEMGMQINVTRQEVFDAMHTI